VPQCNLKYGERRYLKTPSNKFMDYNTVTSAGVWMLQGFWDVASQSCVWA
jgi:hypothetical protein